MDRLSEIKKDLHGGKYQTEDYIRVAVLEDDIAWLVSEVERLNQYVSDLLDGEYINCMYCGWRSGSADEVRNNINALKAMQQHELECERHPLKQEIDRLNQLIGPAGRG